ncbi:hypothetical protein FB451DRAFT_1404388 [Mycena latifolia]|nr:hypothetical protein FB451DRAFT_1404388 [Mycena latifolia]
MLPVASVLPPLPLFFLRASSAASCLLGYATDSAEIAGACGVPAVFKRALYELVRRPSAWASPRTTSARSSAPARISWPSPTHRSSRPASVGEGRLAALARCTTLDALQAGKAQYKLARESGAITEADSAAEGFCVACVVLHRAVWAGRHETVWDNLDIWFRLAAVRAGV